MLPATPQVTGAEVASNNEFIRTLVNTLPNAHGTFMAQAIGTCQVSAAAMLLPLASRPAGTHRAQAAARVCRTSHGVCMTKAAVASFLPCFLAMLTGLLLGDPRDVQGVLNDAEAGNSKTIVLITDGKPTDREQALAAADAVKVRASWPAFAWRGRPVSSH